jgi:DNA helicase II / ATP-dependent DNA helicase PcrA
MTRAKLDLHLIVPQRLYLTKQNAHGDRHVYVPRSCFLPDALTALFETCAWPDPATAMGRTQGPGNGSGPVINIAERVRTRWGSGLH